MNCVEYSAINDKDEREIFQVRSILTFVLNTHIYSLFQRVQLGMALTPAEKMTAIKTPRADFVRELQTKFFKDKSRGLGSFDWYRSRGSNFRYLATTVRCLDRYNISPAHLANAGSIPQLECFLSDPAPLSPSFRSNVIRTFQAYESLVVDEDKNISGVFQLSAADFGGTTTVVKILPVEFIYITILVWVWAEKLGKRALSEAIKDMRRNVRQEHIDVRLKTKVSKTVIDVFKNLRAGDYSRLDGDIGTKGKREKRKCLCKASKFARCSGPEKCL